MGYVSVCFSGDDNTVGVSNYTDVDLDSSFPPARLFFSSFFVNVSFVRQTLPGASIPRAPIVSR